VWFDWLVALQWIAIRKIEDMKVMLRMSRVAPVDRGLGRAADFLVVNSLGCLGINAQAELGPGIIRKAPRLSPTVPKHRA
jgi:hypothetical protein